MLRGVVVVLPLLIALPSWAYELEPELRHRVDRLLVEVKAAASTPENVAPRAEVLWEWGNAVSLQGGFVPKNLPLVTGYVRNPTPGMGINPAYLAAVDTYVFLLAHLDRDPEALGRVGISTSSAAEPLSWQTFGVEWTVGSLGLQEGGGLLVSRHMAGGYGHLQADDPSGDHYVSVVSSRPEIRFEIEEAPVWGPYGGFRGAQPFPVFRVRGGSLEPGEVLTLVYGDRTRGGRGLQVGSFSNDAVSLPLHVDVGEGRFYELPPATFRVQGGPAAGVHGFAPSIVAVGERFTVSLRTEDRFYNRASGEVPGYDVLMNGEQVGEVPAGGEAIQPLTFQMAAPGVYRFRFRSRDGDIEGVANPVWVRSAPETRIFWGETHGHCGFAEGQGTPEGYFTFARDDARLDFVTLSEHDIWLTDGKWKVLTEASRKFYREGELLVFPGYEWTSPRQRGGHHNVFFRRTDMARVPVQEAPDLTLLYQGLRAKHDPDDVLIIPHAHQAGDWRISDIEMENLVEIMSGHGTFEWFGRRYLENGYEVGFAAASDDHLGHPGYSPGHAGRGPRRSNIFQFGGLTGVWTKRNTTDDVFGALKSRRTYATTGARRIILEADLNGVAMGSRLPTSHERRIAGRAIGTTLIRKIDLVRNGAVVHSFDLGSGAATHNATVEIVVGFDSQSFVRFRDNPRGQRTWTGRLTVIGARPRSARFLGTPSPTADRLELEGQSVAFDVATRGSRRTLALVLENVSPATRLRFELDAARELGTAPVQVRQRQRFAAESFELPLPGETPVEKVLTAGRYRDRVTLETHGHLKDDVSFHFSDRGDPGDWYYVRVEQIDGHLAWSSPWWVGGEPPR